MQSVKSYFNPTLFRKNLTRFWPIWGVYLFIWLLVLPLYLLNLRGYDEAFPLAALQAGLFLGLIFGVLSAMAVFSYLYNNKSVQFVHALPITREGLFLTNYLSGLLFLLAPNLIVFLLTLPVGGMAAPRTLLLWLAAQSLICLFFYSFAVFCAMFTGNLLALPIFYGILNFLASGLSEILDSLLGQFLFGYAGTSYSDRLVEWLTPILKMARQLSYRTQLIGGKETYVLPGLSTLMAYGLAALVLTAAALFLYRRRKLEAAGDLVSMAWVRPIFKYGVAFCSAVTLGSFLFETFRSLFPTGRWSILIPLIFSGLIGYFAAEMLLKKRFRVLAASWKGSAAFSLVLVALFLVADNDLVGFNRTPDRSAIVSVTLNRVQTAPYDGASYSQLTLTRAEDIDAVLSLHQNIAANRPLFQREVDSARSDPEFGWQSIPLADGGTTDVIQFTTSTLDMEYTLSDGSTLRRSYALPLRSRRLSQEGSVEQQLTTLLNRPHLVEQAYWSPFPQDLRLVDVSITNPNMGDVSLGNEAQRNALLVAVKADMAAGRITRYLMDTEERLNHCYYNDLIFTFYMPQSTGGNNLYSGERENTSRVPVTVQTTATETLKVLQSLGYSEGSGLTLKG